MQGLPVFADEKTLSIFEVQIEGVRANDEYIRLKNTSGDIIDLTGFKISQKIYSQTKKTCSEETLVTTNRFTKKSIPKDGNFLIAHPDYATFHTLDAPADLFYPTSNTITQNTMEITLLNPKGLAVDTKILGTLCTIKDPPVDEPPASTPLHASFIRINEIFPNPDTPQDTGEYIELFNPNDVPVDLSRWYMTDATKSSGHYTFPAEKSIPAHGYFVITDTDFSFSLNNGKEALSLFDPAGTIIDTTTYTTTVEGASLNWTEAGWRISRTLTPLSLNMVSNSLPTTKERVPKKGYRAFAIHFQANGKDTDGDQLKYVWDFGDDHKSYLEDTSHRYEKSGTYTVTLTTKDGSEETYETFSIKITKFDPPKLRITQLFPNPAGADTAPGAEWIEIKNHSDKKVDLMGYSLATGTKKLTNHPIQSSFVIPKKSVRRLTREYALFSLPNQKGKIELRAPNGKPIHTLKYTFDSSLVDNTLLRKEKGRPLKIIPPLDALASSSQPSSVKEITEPTISPEPLSVPALPAASAVVLLHEQESDQNTSIFLRLTAVGTTLSIPELPTENKTFSDETREDEWLTHDPHYTFVFLNHLSAKTNERINFFFSSGK